jgi:hypothetical protein
MAVGLVLGIKVLILLVDTIRWALFPLGDAGSRLAASLVLVHGDGGLEELCGLQMRGDESSAWKC